MGSYWRAKLQAHYTLGRFFLNLYAFKFGSESYTQRYMIALNLLPALQDLLRHSSMLLS